MDIKEKINEFKEQFNPLFVQEILTMIDEQKSFGLTSISLDEEVKEKLLAYASGGKRIRPFLMTYFSAHDFHKNKALQKACLASELFHLAALIHDDIMDQSPTRRSVPTIHTAFKKNSKHNQRLGEDVALLLGDSFLVSSLQKVQDLDSKIFQEIILMMKRTIRGQYLDSFGMNQDYGEVTSQMIHDRCRLKTSWYTFASPVRLGLLLGEYNLSDSDIQSVTEVYLKLGDLFQMRDDLLDCNPDRSDKKPFEDILENQTTWVSLHIKEHNPESFKKLCEAQNLQDTEKLRELFSTIDLISPYNKEFLQLSNTIEVLKTINSEVYTKTQEILGLLKLS